MKTHNLLWTGGWDSTYRLLDLAIVKKKVVQPYYIIDEQRKSIEYEQKSMEKIKILIEKLDVDAYHRILKTETVMKCKIHEKHEIKKKYNNIIKSFNLGTQYVWLGSFADENNLTLDLCIEKDTRPFNLIKEVVLKIEDDDDVFYVLNEISYDSDLQIFKYYKFPLLYMTKLEMEQKATEMGFKHIMDETWFCHNPINGKPCGTCNPCKDAKEEGLGRRVPEHTKITLIKHKINTVRGSNINAIFDFAYRKSLRIFPYKKKE